MVIMLLGHHIDRWLKGRLHVAFDDCVCKYLLEYITLFQSTFLLKQYTGDSLLHSSVIQGNILPS